MNGIFSPSVLSSVAGTRTVRFIKKQKKKTTKISPVVYTPPFLRLNPNTDTEIDIDMYMDI